MANAFDQFDSGGAAVAERNPFDQFDKAAANPFDKFDATPATAPAAPKVIPKLPITSAGGDVARSIIGAAGKAFDIVGNEARGALSDAMDTITGHPGYGGNLTAAVMGKDLPVDVQNRQLAAKHPYLAAASMTAQGAAGTAPFLLMADVPAMVQKATALGFSAQMIYGVKDLATQYGEEMGKPEAQRDQAKIAQLRASLIQTGVFAPLAGVYGSKGAFRRGSPSKMPTETPAAPEAAATPEAKTATPFEVFQTEKGKYGIFQNDVPVLDPAGNPHEFDSLSDAKIAADKMKQGGQPDLQAGKVISPEVAEAAKAQNIKHPIEEVDETELGDNNPFANKGWATIVRHPTEKGQGTILISKQGLQADLDAMKKSGFSQEKIKKVIETTLFEEADHLKRTPEEGLAYLKTLSPAERALGRAQYGGKGNRKAAGVSDANMGLEHLRARHQQLLGMTRTEIIQAAGKEKWTLKSLDFLERSIRAGRKLAGTTQSKLGDEIYYQKLANIALARTAIGQQPGSPKREQGDVEESIRQTIAGLEAQAVEDDKNGYKEDAAEMRQLAKTLKRQTEEQSFPGSPKRYRPVRPLTEEEKAESARFAAAHPVTPEQEENLRRLSAPLPRDVGKQPELPESILGQYEKRRGAMFQAQARRSEYKKDQPDPYTGLLFKRPTDPEGAQRGYIPSNPTAPVPMSERALPEGISFPPGHTASYNKAEVEKLEAAAKESEDKGDTEGAAASRLQARELKSSSFEGKAELWLESEFQKGKLPKIKDLEAALNRATGGRMQEGAAFDMAQRLINDHLQKAPGAELTKLYQAELNKRARKSGGVPVRPVAPVAEAAPAVEGVKSELLQKAMPEVLTRETLRARPARPRAAVPRAMRPEGAQQELLPITVPEIVAWKEAGVQKKAATTKKMRAGHEARQDVALVKARQVRRQKVVGYLMDRMTRKPLADIKTSLERTSIKPEDIRYGTEWRYPGKEHTDAWKAFSPEAEKTPIVLGNKLVDEASVSGDLPKTVTRRVTAVMGRKTGKVHLVSTYEERGRERVRLLDPDSGAAKQHSSLESILKRYRVLYSALLDQPVQNFRQDFKDLNDFNEKFAKSATELSSKEAAYEPPQTEAGKEGGDFMGPGRELINETGEGSLKRAKRTSMMPAEARALGDLTADAKSEDDVIDALKSLAQKGNRQAISAIQKIGVGLKEKYPNASQQELLTLAAKRILEAHKSSSSPEDFTKKMAAESGTEKEPGSPRRQRPDPNQRKLGNIDTAAALRSYLNPQAQKAAQAQMRRDAELGKPKPGDEPGSPKRQRFAPIQEKAQDEIAKVGRSLKVAFGRRPRAQDITTALDAADNTARNAAREAETHVWMESRGKTFKDRRGNKGMLSAANAPVAAGAVVREYQYTAKAYARRLELEGQSAALKNANEMLNPKNAEGRSYRPTQKQRAWGEEATRKAHQAIEKQLLEERLINHKNAKYSFSDAAKDKLDEFLFRANNGLKMAENYIKNGNWWERRIGRAQKAEATRLINEIEFSKAQWNHPDLRSTAIEAAKQFDNQFDMESARGYPTKYDPNYLPGRYEGEFYTQNGIWFGGQRVLGRNFGAGKVFETPYHAIEQGAYISMTRDISALVGHRIRQGMQRINRGLWTEGLLQGDFKDPVTGANVFEYPKMNADGTYSSPSADYELVYPEGTDKHPIAVLAGADARLIKNLTDPSWFQNSTLGGNALAVSQFLKHTVLMGDLFHLMRVGYYSASIAGRKMQMKPGWAALDMREEDLGRAVEKGVITQKTADYLTEKVAFNNKGKAAMVSRIKLAKMFTQSGFNTGRISDALYMDIVRNVPGFGTYNKFLFDKFTRGLMMNAGLTEFDRISKAHPEMDSNTVIQNISKDLNNYFGSIGRQGWVKSATALDFWRMVGLAPQWFEGLVKKEISPAQWALSGGKAHGTAARGIARGLVTMFVLTQVANLITRRQPTWMNEEKDHKWDADIFGVWVSPLSVFNELLHDVIRLNESKDKTWDAIRQIGENKLGFYGRAAIVLATDRKPSGEYLTSSPGVIGEAAAQLIPTPITFGKVGHALASAATGGRIPPLEPGQAWRQGLATMGIKGQLASQPISDIGRKASKFAEQNGLRPDAVELIATDQPSYAKLRHAIFIGDDKGAARMLVALRKQHAQTPDFENRLVSAMSNWARRPFTGSYKGESMFIDSLDADDRELYEKAQQQRMDIFNKFADWYQQQP